MVHGKEGGDAGTPAAPNRLGDYTDRSSFRGGCSASSSSLGTARKQGGAGGEGMTDPHRWRGDGASVRLKIF